MILLADIGNSNIVFGFSDLKEIKKVLIFLDFHIITVKQEQENIQ